MPLVQRSPARYAFTQVHKNISAEEPVAVDDAQPSEPTGRMPGWTDWLKSRAMIYGGYAGVIGGSVAAGALLGMPLVAPIVGVLGLAKAYSFTRPKVFRAALADAADVEAADDVFPNVQAIAAQLSRQLKLKSVPQLQMPIAGRRRNIEIGSLGTSGASVVVVPPRLVRNMPQREIRAIMGHELAHIAYGDTRSRGLLSAMRFASGMLWMGALGASVLGLTGLIAGPGLPVLAGVFAARAVTVLADKLVDRGQEWRCDQVATKLTRDPVALASGLQRLHDHDLMINGFAPGSDPYAGHGLLSRLIRSIATHPPVWKRVKALTGKPEIEPLPMDTNPIDSHPVSDLLPGLRQRGDGMPLGMDRPGTMSLEDALRRAGVTIVSYPAGRPRVPPGSFGRKPPHGGGGNAPRPPGP